jgi:hypothetical protein
MNLTGRTFPYSRRKSVPSSSSKSKGIEEGVHFVAPAAENVEPDELTLVAAYHFTVDEDDLTLRWCTASTISGMAGSRRIAWLRSQGYAK